MKCLLLQKAVFSRRVQSSVLDLYDPTRLRHPLQLSGNDHKEVTSFAAIDKMLADGLAAVNGKPVVLLTSTVNSPTTRLIAKFTAKYLVANMYNTMQ